MSFGESVFSARFIQKIVKEDLSVEGNYGISLRNLRGKTLEGSRSHVTESKGPKDDMWGRPAPCGPTYQPRRYVGFPPPPRMHLRRCLSRFDPRAHVGPSGLYNPIPASPLGISLI